MRLALLLCTLATWSSAHPVAQAALTPERLRCEYRANPQGIDEAAPRLSWIVTSDQRNQRQTAYQLLVASTPERLGEDTGDGAQQLLLPQYSSRGKHQGSN